MHELSVALGIVDIAEEQVKIVGAKKVDGIQLEVGTLSGVELEALDFAWDIAVNNTVLDGAEKEVIRVEGKAKCCNCGHEFTLEHVFEACPVCNEYNKDLIQGRELRVKSLVVS